MLAVEKWAQGKNPLMAYFAIIGAVAARDQSEALQHIKERRIFGHQIPLPDFPSWFAMYQSLKPLLTYKRLMSHNSDFTKEQFSQLNEFRKLNKALKLDPDQLKGFMPSLLDFNQSLEYWHDMCSNLFTEIKENIAENQLYNKLEDKLFVALKRDDLSLSFYFLVYAPCQLHYKSSPSSLYRESLKGNVSAIEQLLKIDPLILHDPAIGFQIQSVRLYGKANDYDGILKAISKHSTINYKDLKEKRKNLKSDHGGLIYVLATALNGALKVPQIRDLYDALAQDFEGARQDDDVTSPEGFDKTIKTKAAQWQHMFQKPEKQK
jgi:hypothetical protein